MLVPLAVSAASVVATWVLVLALAIGIGSLASPAGDGPTRVRRALWLGLAAIVALAVSWNLVSPLAGTGALPVILLALGGAAAGLVRMRRSPAAWTMPRGSAAVLAVAFAAAIPFAGYLALGRPLNYDAGLYHLGSTAYAAEFGTVPGLANLHDRFGFNSSTYPLGALLGNGPLAGQGFRMVAGLLMAALALDAILRLCRPRREPPGAGTLVMLGGSAIAIGFLLAVSGDRLASPTPDALAMVLVIAASAYTVDALARDEGRRWDAGIAIAIAALCGSARPLNWAIWLATVIVVLVAWRPRPWRAPIVVGLALSAWIGAAMAARDALLSGWLLFPASALPLPVPWRAADPSESAYWIRAWAQYRSSSATEAPMDGPWLADWASRSLRDWSVLLGLAMLALALALIALHRRPSRQYWAVAPIALAVALWFATAPDPRFAWGPLLAAGLVPLAVALSHERPGAAATGFARIGLASLVLLGMAGSLARGGFGAVVREAEPTGAEIGGIAIVAGPVPVPATRARSLADGTAVVSPTASDQCWSVFPLCLPSYASTEIRLRGPGPRDGFERAPG